MKKLKKIKEKILLHPIMSFLFLTAFFIVLSGVLDLLDASVTYNRINPRTRVYEPTLVTVESLFSLSGLKYIFSSTVSNFVSFTPLSTLLIVLIGIGIMDKSGFLDTMFFLLTKHLAKNKVTFIFVLMCILATITGDLAFVVFIPLAALLFKYGKRNPMVGIVTAFAALSLGYGINLVFSSVDSSLSTYTVLAARDISIGYKISSMGYLYIMLIATIISAGIITYITEAIIAPSIGKYEVEEEEVIEDKEKLTRRELRGLIIAGFGALIYLSIFIYNIIPNVPFGGNLLDYSQARYIDKLFGYDSFFNNGFVFVITFFFVLVGLLYGLGTKEIKNHRDICDALSHSLDGIGKVIVLLFFASIFYNILRYTNIGLLLTAYITNLFDGINFGGIPLIIVVILIGMVTTPLSPVFLNRWMILSGTIVPKMITNGFTPEFAQLLFSVGSSLTYAITPAMAYFVIYIAFMEKYDKEGIGLTKGIKYMMPYTLAISAMWIVLIIIWYLVGLPLGVQTLVVA